MIPLAAAAAFACLNPVAVDGDTLRCGQRKVRLSAINARELHGNSCTGSAPCPAASATESRAALQALLDRGPVRCTSEGQDRYGRTVARCAVGGQDVGCQLVTTGHAAEWRKFGRAC